MLTIIYLNQCQELKRLCKLLDKVTKLVISPEILWKMKIKNPTKLYQEHKLIEFRVKFKKQKGITTVSRKYFKTIPI